jgi:phosphoribosylformimino-5-aminoimidazole carboxamide ribotide isomerase
VEVIKRSSCPVQAGGGLRTRDDVAQVLHAGASRAVLGTFALEDPKGVEETCREFGPRIAVSLDARGGELASHGWTVGTGMPLLEAVGAFEAAGVSTFIYTDVERDGTMAGPNLEGLRRLVAETSLPVIASGGVSSLDDLRTVATLREEGVTGAIVGRALYEGSFTVAEANSAVRNGA